MTKIQWLAPHNDEGDRRGEVPGATYWYLIGPDRGGWSVTRCDQNDWWTVARDCESEAIAQIVAQVAEDKYEEKK